MFSFIFTLWVYHKVFTAHLTTGRGRIWLPKHLAGVYLMTETLFFPPIHFSLANDTCNALKSNPHFLPLEETVGGKEINTLPKV